MAVTSIKEPMLVPQYDNDESTAEFLIQNMKLDDVLAFINARDEVRRIPPYVDPCEVTAETLSTIPAAGHVEPASGVVVRTTVELEIESVG